MQLTRFLYSGAWWLALPMVLIRLWWLGRADRGYRQHLGERLGLYRSPASSRKLIWVHAVSVGETRAAEPLVDALLAAFPDHAILLTHMTPTGRATGRDLFGGHGERVLQSYLPYDTGWMVQRFIRHFAPRLCVLMETEVWPNLMAQCRRHGVPVALVNARLSERSLRKGQRLSALMLEAARGLACVAAQTENDAARLRQLGAPNVQVTGSIKFDAAPPEAALAAGGALRAQFGDRPVLLCASTRDGEEVLLLDAFMEASGRDVLLVIVPRHPQRFDEVERRIRARDLRMIRRSSLGDRPVSGDTRVVLGDSMGEMFAYYGASDVAFIGGSLLPLGGQNLIEACALGKPVLVGPHTFNFSDVSEDAVAAGAACRVTDARHMMRESNRLLHAPDERQTMGMRAREFALQHRGATARTLALLQPYLQADERR